MTEEKISANQNALNNSLLMLFANSPTRGCVGANDDDDHDDNNNHKRTK